MTNLIMDNWLPVRRGNGGEIEMIAPWQITDQHNTDPIVALAAPRADFNGALMQFLIGLLQTVAPPTKADNDDWLAGLEQAPAPEVLQEKFGRIQHAFNLNGDGPRFMQDFDELQGKAKPVSFLLIDSPGEKPQRDNKDHFVKRGGINGLCPACAASALFTLQTNAPEGGAGNLTSLRGGGPLTTLAIVDSQDRAGLSETLWRNVWLNVLRQRDFESLTDGSDKQTDADIFPWLAPTRSSDIKHGGEFTYPRDVNPLQMYWALPRRIRLDWENTRTGECDICGAESDQLVCQYFAKTYGVNYKGPWKHPLSPHNLDRTDNAPMPQHPQPGGMSYRHWLRFVAGEELSEAAKIIIAFNKRNPEGMLQLRLWAFGYDMDSMKARCWYETTYPLYLLDENIRAAFIGRAQALVEAAIEVSKYVRGSVKEAWFKRPGDAKGDTSFLIESFFQHTEKAFFHSLRRLRDELATGGDGIAVLNAWHGELKRAALELFDYWAARGDVSVVNPRRIAMAHKKLNNLLNAKKLKQLLLMPDKKEKAA